MSARLRRSIAAALALVFLVGVATPAWSGGESMKAMMDGSDPVSPTVDALLLRPVGFVTLVVGTALFVASAPIVLISRPHEIGKPFDRLVVRPAKYVWVDPLGSH